MCDVSLLIVRLCWMIGDGGGLFAYSRGGLVGANWV